LDCAGGGLPVGSLLLIQEDYSGNYAKLLLKYFLGKKMYIFSFYVRRTELYVCITLFREFRTNSCEKITQRAVNARAP
jgi:hypothetical protein